MRRAGWITAVAGGVVAVAALLLNGSSASDEGADIGAGVLFLFALAVMGGGAALFLVGVYQDDIGQGEVSSDGDSDRSAWK